MKIIVVGAGASGLMCAYQLKKKCFDVTIIEKEDNVGKKILITGKGRCNVTNHCTFEDFFSNVITNDKFLYSAYSNFSSQDTMDFFEHHGVHLVTERGNRVFPASYQAEDIVKCLYKSCIDLGVEIKTNEKVVNVQKLGNSFTVTTISNQYFCDKVVIATGGLSYPLTGSTGDGYRFAENFAHTIVPQVPALCALRIKEKYPKTMYKFTLKNVSIKATNLFKKYEEFGELTFYKEGIAGAAALSLSSQINRISPENINLSIDFKPALSNDKLNQRLIREATDPTNKHVKDIILKLLPSEVYDWFVELKKIDVYAPVAELTKEMRQKIVDALKNFKLSYMGLDDISRATVTSGGVSVKEVDPKSMESKRSKGLFFVGEILDVDAYTGGFNLQIAFSTAALVAKALAEQI